ncbi:MAG: hypothetical protein E3J96_00195 [Sulfurovum sp.]|nr:MAG: hypothetical protein E3J96_00195 [Sulfurovum sp.]
MRTNKQKLLDYYLANYNQEERSRFCRVTVNHDMSIYVDKDCYDDHKKGDDISSLYLSYVVRGVNVALSAIHTDEPLINEILEAIGEKDVQ